MEKVSPFFFFYTWLTLKWMVNHLSRINDSGAMKPTISKTQFWKLAKAVENLLVQRPHFSKLQTKHVLLYRHCLSDGQFISQPLNQDPHYKQNFPPNFKNKPNRGHRAKSISLGIHAWDEDFIGNGDEGGHNVSHVGSRGWFLGYQHFWKTHEPTRGNLWVHFCFSISRNNFISGMDS